MNNKTWQGLGALAAALLLWWLSGKPEIIVSVGDEQPVANGIMASSLAPLHQAQQTVAVDELIEPIDPLPTFIHPLAVELRGPRDAMVGDMIDLAAEITGAAPASPRPIV